MNKPNPSPQAPVHHRTVPVNQDYGSLTMLDHSGSIAFYLRYAAEVFTEHDLALPEPGQLNLIVRSALAVQYLYLAACLRHPDKAELDKIFEMFLLACVACTDEKENECPYLKYD